MFYIFCGIMPRIQEIFHNRELSKDFSSVIDQELWDNFKFNANTINNTINNDAFFLNESLIDKLEQVHNDIEFWEIKDENINLYDFSKNIRDFKNYINDNIEWITAIARCIHDKVQTYLTALHVADYNDFDTAPDHINAIPTPLTAEKFACYLESIWNYLSKKHNINNHLPKADIIFSNIDISNEDINANLPIPVIITSHLNTIAEDTKDFFDKILAFEIKDKVATFSKKSETINKQIQNLFSNTIPAINTLIASSKYKYEEDSFWADFHEKYNKITNDSSLSTNEKEKYKKQLEWAYYINDLKKKNAKLGKCLSELYTVDLSIATDPNKYYSSAPISNVFDYSLVSHTTLKEFLDEMANISLTNLFIGDTYSKNPAAQALKLSLSNIDTFKTFYKELADIDTDHIHLITVWAATLDIPVTKTIQQGSNSWLTDISEYKWNPKPSDSFPIKYEIKKSDIDSLSLNTEDKINLSHFLSQVNIDNDKYIFEWDNIWKLMYLFFLFNSATPIDSLESEAQKDVQKIFWKANNKKHPEIDTEWNFIKNIERLAKDGVKFQNGAEIWIPSQESELPWWGNMWMKIKIDNINKQKWTFVWQVFWWELQFKKWLEWKTKEFDMNDDTIQSFNKLAAQVGWSPILVDGASNFDFNTYYNSHKELCSNTLWFPPEWVKRENNKFIRKIKDEDGNEKEEEVKYFWWESWNDTYSYQVEYIPSKRKFKISSVYTWWQNKDNKELPIRHKYEKLMDWNNFLFFMKEKKLKPQNQEEHDECNIKEEQKLKMMNWWHWHITWSSISSFIWSIKSITKSIKWKMDAYNKAQQANIEDILIWDWKIYDKLSNILWFIPSMKSWLGELQTEYYNDRDNRTWKKIEWYLKIFQADPDFWTTFDQLPPHIKTSYGTSLQNVILNRVANTNGQLWDPWIYQAAALLLANIDKGWSPYRGLRAQENSWLWVKALLGNAHYQQFMVDKAKLIKARDLAEKSGSWDKKWLNETLAACEMKYIINNIRWSYKWLVTWSYEERGIPWEENTNYIDNPSKRLLSDQFASKLESAYDWRFTKDSVQSKYSKYSKNNSFDEIENEFWKTSSTRYQVWQAALRRMIDLAWNDSLKKRMKQHFLEYLLCWALDINCDPWLKKQVYSWAKPMMFVPWLLVKEAGVAENIAILLDTATHWDFSKNVTEYFHRDNQLNWWPADFKKLQWQLNQWLTDNKINEIESFFWRLQCQDFSWLPEPNRSVMQKYQKVMWDSSRDEFDRWILDNPTAVSNWLLSSVEVAQSRMDIKNWEFAGKDIDEKSNMAEFWKKVTKDINWRSFRDKKEVSFVLEKFFNRFWIDNQQVYEWIITADYYNKHQWPFKFSYNDRIELDMWRIWKKEIDSILWYAFQWNARKSRWLWCDRLPDELLNTLVAFRTFLSNAFYEWTLLDTFVKESAFKPKNADVIPLCMGSRYTYDQTFSWDWDSMRMFDSNEDDLFSSDKDKQNKAKKNKIKNLLKSSDFINADIVNIEKRLKSNLGWTSNQYMSVTSAQSKNLRESLFRDAA